ncbi:MAG TPA: T9SS type A sorting domain-containing protein [Bacteroidia bacterium]|nr:T9SS type A sorting domain-containing protein [Bacteroidia bacterium]
MKLIISILVFLILTYSSFSQSFNWAFTVGGKSDDGAISVLSDAHGNLYTLGYFRDTVDFDIGPPVYNHVAQSPYYPGDIFLIVTDSLGNYKWSKQIGGPGAIAASSMAMDGEMSIYIIGQFVAPIDFDPGPSVANLPYSGNGANLFLIKLDSLGNYVWGKSLGGIGTQVSGTEISLGAGGSLYFTGSFCTYGFSPLDFDPGPGTSILSSGFYANPFVCKWDTAGNFIWAKGFVAPPNSGISGGGKSVKEDSFGNVFTLGSFESSATQQIDFDPGPGVFTLSSIGMEDVFISKLDINGSFIWAKSFGSTGRELPSFLQLDNSGNIFVNGSFQNNCDFDPGSNVLNISSNGDFDIFLSKLNPLGGIIWCKTFGGIGTDYGKHFSIDDSSNVISIGVFTSTVDLDSGPNTCIYNCTGVVNSYILKLDSTGSFKWARQLKGINLNSSFSGNFVSVNEKNSVYISGLYNGAVDINPDFQQNIILPFGGDEAFVLKLGKCFINIQTDFSPVICKYECVSLNVIGAINYTWMPGSVTSQSYNVCPLTTSTYTVIGALGESCKSVDTVVVTVENCTSINEDELNNNVHLVSPNPSEGKITVNLDYAFIGTITIWDILGRAILTKRIDSINEYEINLENVNNGVFVLQLNDEKGNLIAKEKLIVEVK